ncbi:SAM-dependent methyltransferase [Treponema pedis]|uniref:SAM-dependent methyltransferase n=1 Tax=Treponema pedis TaxID=409322 RepID=UPI00040DAD6F|nr:SAM-dependent methyltransferase [Treponema pedis]
MKKEKLAGAEGFEIYYAKLFGSRWNNLKTSLLEETKQVAYTENLIRPYFLDYASVQAAKAVPELTEGSCLDMCAAPGGKTLVLLSRIKENTQITANEVSADRRNRLIKVLDEHLCEENRLRINITGYDACKMPKYKQNIYDRILLDAPCSSERHVLKNEKYLKQWSEARIKNLAQRQWALLSAAFLLLKTEGFLVYSTCALSDLENDSVVKKLILKYKDKVLIHNSEKSFEPPPFAEKTEHGYMFLPDTAEGAGPIYFSVIQKKE